MPFPVIPSFVTVGLFRLGFKFAENKRWLPDVVYHHLSVSKFKDGDMEKARHFNSIAISKNPGSEKAQVMRDIINMNKDAGISALEKRMRSEHDAIEELYRNEKVIKKQLSETRHKKIVLKTFFYILMAGYIAGISLWAMSSRSTWFYVVLCAGIVVFSAILFYHRTAGLAGIRETILEQERSISIKTIEKELNFRKKRLLALRSELDELKISYGIK